MSGQETIKQLEKTQAILAEKQAIVSDMSARIEALELMVSLQQAQLDEYTCLLQQKEELLQKMAIAVRQKDSSINSLKFDYKNLQHQIGLLKKRVFGVKTERHISTATATDPNQSSLFEGTDFGQDAQTQELIEKQEKQEKKDQDKPHKAKAVTKEGDYVMRMELPEHLERETIEIDPEGIDLTKAVKIGAEITEQLLFTPAVVKVRRYIRNKYLVTNQGVRNLNPSVIEEAAENQATAPEEVKLQNAGSSEVAAENQPTAPEEVKLHNAGSSEVVAENQPTAPALSDTNIEEGQIIIAPLPDDVILKLKCTLETLAYLLVSKYVDHIPIYRMGKILSRSGIHVKYNTLSNWVQQGANRLVPLLNELEKTILKSRYLMADETPCRVVDNTPNGTDTKGYYWVYRAYDSSLVLFDFQPDRSSEVPLSRLRTYKGYVQCDGYSGYNKLFKENLNVHRLGCLAHARRKFTEAKNFDSTRANHALDIIQRIYAVERNAANLYSELEKEAKETAIKAYRKINAIPLWTEFEQWLIMTYQEIKPKTPLSKAVNYSMSELPYLKAYLEQGYLRIDNNWVENSIRPTAIGRKNYLYAGSIKTAQNSALMYSLVESCRINGINPYEYLLDLLKHLPETNIQKLNDLLPNNWRKN
jgi:transposase